MGIANTLTSSVHSLYPSWVVMRQDLGRMTLSPFQYHTAGPLTEVLLQDIDIDGRQTNSKDTQRLGQLPNDSRGDQPEKLGRLGFWSFCCFTALFFTRQHEV